MSDIFTCKENNTKSLILNLKDDKVTPLNVASALIDFAIDYYSYENDIEFIRQLSEHLEIEWKSCERNRYRHEEEDNAQFYIVVYSNIAYTYIIRIR